MSIIILLLVAVLLYGFWIFIHSDTKDTVCEATLVDYWTITAPTITNNSQAQLSGAKNITEVVFEIEGKEVHLRSEKMYFEDMLNKKGTLTYRNGKYKSFVPYK